MIRVYYILQQHLLQLTSFLVLPGYRLLWLVLKDLKDLKEVLDLMGLMDLMDLMDLMED
jgi:hypothetical protein